MLSCRSVEGNSLTGYVPRSLFNRTDLIFTYTPRGLCTGSSPTAQCTALPEPVIPVAPPVASKSNSNSKMTIIIGTVAGVLGILILVCCICLLRWRPKLASSISSKKLLNADPEAGNEAIHSIQSYLILNSFGNQNKGKT